ncbi:hypothetical protein [Gemmata sp.]|uniref:hypothetical protein n=1 Tax=Gemmata sp. TaxID=1914242 RepID=UPI003F710403
MTLLRLLAWSAFAAVVLPAGQAAAQDAAKLPQSPPGTSLLSERREARGIPPAEMKVAQAQFATFAKYYADLISHPLLHKAAQDPSLKQDASGREIPSVDTIIKDLGRFLLEPNPAVRTSSDDPRPKVRDWNADYIRELGVAFDAALKPLVDTHPERVVRVNAARLYAAVCTTGANAHWPTVTAWVANPNTPTEIKYYALQAAANLLDAYDVFDYRSRRHAFTVEPRSAANKQIGELIAALQACVTNPNALVPLTDGKAENATSEQLQVVGFVRRQAIKALGRCRFVTLPGPTGAPLYPAHTLVRVCLSDPTLVPAPVPADCGEAIIGLCNMAPVNNGAPVKGYNGDAVAEAVAAAVLTFASPRASNPLDRSLPWRGYAIRMGDAFRNWRPLFDPLYDPTAPTKFEAQLTPKAVADVIAQVQTSVLAPMDKAGAGGLPDRVDIEKMRAYLRQLQANPKRNNELITGVPATALPKYEVK